MTDTMANRDDKSPHCTCGRGDLSDHHSPSCELVTEGDVDAEFTAMDAFCECSDPGCPVAHGSQTCGKPTPPVKVRRVDLDDGEQTFDFCEACAADALSSGVFA